MGGGLISFFHLKAGLIREGSLFGGGGLNREIIRYSLLHSLFGPVSNMRMDCRPNHVMFVI